MRLIIAEKPSLGRAIASVLPQPHSQKQGYIQCGDNTIVTWCLGHLLEPAEPEGYHPQYARWQLADLPITPTQWKLTPRNDTLKQLRTVGTLLESALEAVHAGDPDREGQLLVDEVINYFNTEVPVHRLLINDLTPRAISIALSQLKPNNDYRNLSYSAQSRQRADWLYGINLTRAITLISRQQGKEGVFSVGRVQTPVLGLIVKRDAEIANFKSTQHFTVEGTFHPINNDREHFSCQWKIPPSRAVHCDDQGRLLNQKVAERVVQKVRPSLDDERPEGRVINVADKQTKESPPLPFSLSTLQIEAAKRYRYNPQSVLDSCQMLYEKYQLITYPRSDCRFLPDSHYQQRHDVLNTIIANSPRLAGVIQQCNSQIRSRAWNDKKVEAHHAIIPTERHFDVSSLHEREQNIYHLICRNYIAQFYPDLITDESSITLSIANESFEGKAKAIRQWGWKKLFQTGSGDKTANQKHPTSLPALREGDIVLCHSAEVKSHETTPPSPFTDATLLSAMTNIARFVEDADIRRTLRETDGLGTEATRAGIIETLFKRGYIIKNGQYILSTDKGKGLINALPPVCTKPDMTATWEATLETIHSGSTKPDDFVTRLSKEIGHLIEQLTGQPLQKHSPSTHAPSKPPTCPKCQAAMVEKSGKYGKFWACSGFPECKATLPWRLNTTRKAKSVQSAGSPPIPCPNCHAPLVKRTGSKGVFWGCSNYPSCRQSFSDIDGRPHISIHNKR